MWCELAFAVAACVYVGWRGEQFPMQTVAFATLALYVVGIVFAMVMWLPQLVNR